MQNAYPLELIQLHFTSTNIIITLHILRNSRFIQMSTQRPVSLILKMENVIFAEILRNFYSFKLPDPERWVHSENNSLRPWGKNYLLDFEKQLKLGEILRGHTASDRKAHMYTTVINENRECSKTRSTDTICCLRRMPSNSTSSNMKWSYITMGLTYLLTPWSRVLLEKLISKLCS